MSHNEYLNWLYVDKCKLEELEETKIELEKQLLSVKNLSNKIGKKISNCIYIRELNESSKCKNCNLISAIVRDNLCYLCC